ncbi:hypothetical protein ACFO0S_05995 [Chryseomicrobium palamuruense]|uniref:Exopolyphosphatase n=1 Tax=Chryseomicrobium palamuruense TaxID=682973 RepID=A0ABV8UTI9_9BACL
MENLRAIIDIGSNSIRLVVYSYSYEKGLEEHHNIKTVARLSGYLNEQNEMQTEGIDRLIETLLNFQAVLNDLHIKQPVIAATAAVRQASNQQHILERVCQETGLTIEVLSAKQEAYYGYLAVVLTTNIRDAMTVDMGGGSTEVTLYKDKQLVESYSFPFGVVTLKNKFVSGDVPTLHERKAIKAFVHEQFKEQPWIQGKGLPVITIGGSARNIVQIDQNRKNYPLSGTHQYEMSLEDIRSIDYLMKKISFSERKKIDGLSSDRADVIDGAIITFETLLELTGSTLFMHSRKGLREGIIIEKLEENKEHTFFLDEVDSSAIRHLHGKFAIEAADNTDLIDTFQKLRGQFAEAGWIQDWSDDPEMLTYAYQLFHFGKQVDIESASQHTFYLLTNSTLDGFTNKQKLKLALLSSYKNKQTFQQYIQPYQGILTMQEIEECREAGALLRFVHSLQTTKHSSIVDATMFAKGEDILLTLFTRGSFVLEAYQAAKMKKHIEKLINRNVILAFEVEEIT